VRSFNLAPMSKLILVLTIWLCAIPVAFVFSPLLLPVGAAMCLLYAAIWLIGRPLRFEITPRDLVIVWPVRQRSIPRSDIVRVRLMKKNDLKKEIRWGARVGAGGLWGGFGRAYTNKGWMELWVSREDWSVFVERKNGIPLILTPDQPEQFVEMLSASS
jgi:hypothetical protein